MPPLNVVVLQPSLQGSNSCFAEVDDYDCTPAHFFPPPEALAAEAGGASTDPPRYVFTRVPIRKATAVQQINKLVQSTCPKYDVYVNLCDGAWDEDRAGKEVVQALEHHRVPFTGADSVFYEPSKGFMKMMAHYQGVKTPRFVFAHKADDVEVAHQELRYPMIVKHFNGYSSIGMSERSRVTSREQLHAEAARFIADFGGALIEEFVEGREVTVLVAESRRPGDDGARVYHPVECSFPPGQTFKHFELKWKDFDGIQWSPLDVSTPEGAALSAKLVAAARGVFSALRGVSYGRADFRVDAATGEPYFLEMNPNCGIFYPPGSFGSADFILSHDAEGHAGFVHLIIETALARRAELDAQRTCVVTYHPRTGYGLTAARELAAGETVLLYEGKGHTLISRSKVQREWGAADKESFDRYAYPISDDVWAIWSENPDDWRPINHSCDPNAWLVGNYEMDMVARRQIKLGEAITIDYATFAVDFLPFDCLCGHACCRKRILPTDCLLPAISDTFGDHMSAYVHKRILQHKAQQAAAATRKSLEGGVPIGGRDNSPHQQPANGATVTS